MTTRFFYGLSWILFLVTILYLGWDNARLYHLAIAVLAIPGVLIAVMWIVRKSKWSNAALGISVVTVLGYIVWWSIEIFYRFDSTPSLLETISTQFRIPRLLFEQRLSQDDYLGALLEAYWQLGMPVLQIVFAILIVRGIFRPRIETPARAL